MTIKLTRWGAEPMLPILVPEMFDLCKNGGVFNVAVIYWNGAFRIVYRGTDIGGHNFHKNGEKYQSFLGYTESSDLKNWQHYPKPVLVGEHPFEARECEDPRIVCIDEDEIFWMLYTGFGDRFPGDISICLASSKDLINWEKHGILLDERNKNSSLFPEKINGEYTLLHRRGVDIWISFAKELGDFRKNKIKSWKILSPILGTWQETRIGIAGPPVAHPKGWLLFYHGVNSKNEYRLGVVLLDHKKPQIVKARQEDCVLEPKFPWEIDGHVRNIIFSCTTINWREFVVVFYSGADTVTHVAYVKKEDVVFEEKDRIKIDRLI